jgi:hypothetical protein
MRCLSCDYELGAQALEICPECGRQGRFSDARVRAFRAGVHKGSDLWIPLTIGAGFLTAGFAWSVAQNTGAPVASILLLSPPVLLFAFGLAVAGGIVRVQSPPGQRMYVFRAWFGSIPRLGRSFLLSLGLAILLTGVLATASRQSSFPALVYLSPLCFLITPILFYPTWRRGFRRQQRRLGVSIKGPAEWLAFFAALSIAFAAATLVLIVCAWLLFVCIR